MGTSKRRFNCCSTQISKSYGCQFVPSEQSVNINIPILLPKKSQFFLGWSWLHPDWNFEQQQFEQEQEQEQEQQQQQQQQQEEEEEER